MNKYIQDKISAIIKNTAEKMIKMLEESKGKGKWVKPFFSTRGFHKNNFSGHIYRGVNALLLSAIAEEKGYTSNRWATFNQWKEIKRFPKSGEHCTEVFIKGRAKDRDEKGNPIPETDENGNILYDEKGNVKYKTHPFANIWQIFNECQLQDYIEPEPEKVDENVLNKINMFKDNFLDRIGATYSEGHGRACYIPSLDVIELPSITQYHKDMLLEYIPTACHECTHWTGHKSRLNRDLSGWKGSDSYAFEELIADIGAGFLSAEYGQSYLFSQNNLKYIESWIEQLKDHPKILEDACFKAHQAADYLLKLASHDED